MDRGLERELIMNENDEVSAIYTHLLLTTPSAALCT